MADEKKELNELDANDVSGGYLFNAYGCGHDDEPWEAIGKRGEILKRFGSREDAKEWLDKNNFSDRQISWNTLANLRETSGILEEEKQYVLLHNLKLEKLDLKLI